MIVLIELQYEELFESNSNDPNGTPVIGSKKFLMSPNGISLAAFVQRGIDFLKENQEEVSCMAGKNTAAYGIYRDRGSLECGVDALRAANFRAEDISVLFPENVGTKDFAHEKGTKAPEGASAGAGGGAALGGILGWLAGIGAIAVPGVGPLIARARSWAHLREPAWVEPLVVSRER